MFNGRLTWRELDAFVTGLPAESLTQTAIRDKYDDEQLAQMAAEQTGYGRWGRQDYMMADLIDAVKRLIWITLSVNLTKGSPPPSPEPIRRPGVVDPQVHRRRYIEDQKQRFLMRQSRRQRELPPT